MDNHRLRPRATAVVVRNGKVLLARNRGQRLFALPGGGIRNGESVEAAAARELYKELRLESVRIERLPHWDYEGSANRHHVCLVHANGEPVRRRLELSGLKWWDMKEPVPVFRHVTAILSKIWHMR